MKVKVERAWVEVIPDEDPDPSYLEQEEFEDRREAYARGDFAYVGVRACAEIRFETERGGWISGPIVKSPGLWGVESDSGEDYIRSVAEDEAGELADMLEALSIDRARAEYARRMATNELHYT